MGLGEARRGGAWFGVARAAVSGRVLTLMQLATKWGWSRSKLQRLVARKGIPHLRLNARGDVHFVERDVDRWLEEQTVRPKSSSPARRTSTFDEDELRLEQCRELGIEPDHSFT